MRLQDLEGNDVGLESLAGQPILLQLIAAQHDQCLAYTGGSESGPFRGIAPTPDFTTSWDERLAQSGLPRDSPNLLRVHVLVFDGLRTPATLELAQAWDAHFQLSAHDNTRVFVADPRYACLATFSMIPGYHLIDRDFTFVSNGIPGGDPLERHTLSLALRLARREQPPPFPEDQLDPPTAPPSHEFAPLGNLLDEARYAELDAALEAFAVARRYPGSYEDRLSDALSWLRGWAFPALRAWSAARPKSAYPLIVMGARHVDQGWEARGSGWANTVTEEGWAGLREHLTQARGVLEKAIGLRPDLPHAYRVLLSVDMGLGVDKPTTRAHVEAARAIDPAFVEVYIRYLEYLQPRWYGSNEELLAFAAEARAALPDEPAMAYVEGVALEFVIREEVGRKHAAPSWRKYLRARPDLAAKIKALALESLEAYPRAVPSLKWLRGVSKVPEPRDDALWLRATRALAEQEEPQALLELGMATSDGEAGIERDRVAGSALLLRAAQRGSAEAAARVAYAFARSHAPGTDARARAWYAHAADLGRVSSLRHLAILVLEGRGGPADPAEGQRLLELAAQGGDARAAEMLQQKR